MTLVSHHKQHDQEIAVMKTQMKEVSRDLGMKEKQCQKKQSEHQSLQSQYELLQVTLEQKYTPEILALQKKVSLGEEHLEELRSSLNTQDLRYAALIDQYKEKLHSQSNQCDQRTREEQDKARVLYTKYK